VHICLWYHLFLKNILFSYLSLNTRSKIPVPGCLPYGRWMDMTTSSKITFADRHKLAHSSLKQHGGLTATVSKNL
jgi:hypothetical protein